MTSQTPEMHAVLERLERLERQNRRAKRLGQAGVLLGAAVLLTCRAAPRSRVVEAEELILRDSQGKVRIRLGETQEEPLPQLKKFEAEIQRKLEPSLVIYDPEGRQQVRLAWSELLRESMLTFYGREGKEELYLGQLGMTFYDPAHPLSPHVAITVVGGKPRLALTDKNGFMSAMGSTEIVTTATGKTRETSAASLIMFDKDGHAIWRTP